jgi:hypothetical protein
VIVNILTVMALVVMNAFHGYVVATFVNSYTPWPAKLFCGVAVWVSVLICLWLAIRDMLLSVYPEPRR